MNDVEVDASKDSFGLLITALLIFSFTGPFLLGDFLENVFFRIAFSISLLVISDEDAFFFFGDKEDFSAGGDLNLLIALFVILIVVGLTGDLDAAIEKLRKFE